MRQRHLIAATILIGLIGSAALAHKGATGAVKVRMDQMKSIADEMKAIGAMIKGKATYDGATMQSLAGAIAARGGAAMTEVFREPDLSHPSESRPEIWTDWDRFARLADDMQARAAELADGATDPARSTARFAALAETCKACHQDFRIRK